MPTARVNGVELYYRLSGHEGEPLVLVHGSWGDHTAWNPVAPSFAGSHRVLVYDRRGHSRSERPAGQGSKREDAADLAALIEHLDLAPAHIVGNSFGAAVVLQLATERPELFRSLVVHEPPLFGVVEEPSAREAIRAVEARARVAVTLLEAGQMERGARHFVEAIMIGPGAWEQLPDEIRQRFIFNAPTWLDEMNDPEWEELDVELLADFGVPVLLTKGGRSGPHFAPVVDALALPDAVRRTYPEAGHVPYASHPEEYIAAVTSFIVVAGAGSS